MSDRIEDLVKRIEDAGMRYPFRVRPAFALNTNIVVNDRTELVPALEKAYALSPIEEVRVYEMGGFMIEE